MKIRTSEYITISTHKDLIGKKAKFKNDARYSQTLWGKKGTIKQLHMITEGDLNHVGLSIVFDKKEKMNSCYIMSGSYELIK